MEQQQNNSAKFAFFYMLSLVALVFTALPAGMIIFQIINKKIIDAISQNSVSFSPDQLKFAISAIIIATPIYYLTMRQIFKNLVSGALSKDSGIRKWLTYFILLVASVIMLGWLIAIINNFLDGELTLKIILKALTAIAIAAVIFTFYFYDIKRENVAEKNKIIELYLYGSLAAVAAVFIASLFFVESPQATRDRKYDEAIVGSFSMIESAINSYYYEKDKLPGNLDELTAGNYYITADDLATPDKKKIEYKITGADTFELCADFKTSNKSEAERYGYYDYYDKSWLHENGYQCVGRKATVKGEIAPPPVY